MDPWCPPQEGSSWIPGRPCEISPGLAEGLGGAGPGASLLGLRVELTHSCSLRRLHCSRLSPRAALAARIRQGWRKTWERVPACLIPSLCTNPTWPWLPLERQMLTNQAIALNLPGTAGTITLPALSACQIHTFSSIGGTSTWERLPSSIEVWSPDFGVLPSCVT